MNTRWKLIRKPHILFVSLFVSCCFCSDLRNTTHSGSVLILGPIFPGSIASRCFPIIVTKALLTLLEYWLAETRSSQVFYYSWSAAGSFLFSSCKLFFLWYNRKRKKQLHRLFFCVNPLMIFIITITRFPAVSFQCSFTIVSVLLLI